MTQRTLAFLVEGPLVVGVRKRVAASYFVPKAMKRLIGGVPLSNEAE